MNQKIFYSLFGCDAGGLVRSCNDCFDDEPNRIVHVALYHKGATLNRTLAGLVTSLLNLEKTCDAFIIRNTNGTMAATSYSSGKGAGKQASRILSAVHSITFTDFDIVNNIEDFWNPAISAATNYNLVFFTSTNAWVVDAALTIAPDVPITDDINTFIESAIKIDWSAKLLPIPLTVGGTEVDKLETCPTLFVNTTGFINRSGSMASLSPDGYTATVSTGNTVNIALSSQSSVISTAEVTSGTLPTGLVLSVASNGLSMIITGSSTQTGTYLVSLRASNSCGVGSEVVLKIVIQ